MKNGYPCKCGWTSGLHTPGCSESPEVKQAEWDAYFMRIAEVVATRATCPRKSVGSVLTAGHRIIATGYNGSMRGAPHCTDEGVGCLMEDDHCVRTIHAEENAILQAAQNGVPTQGSTLYTTSYPCWPCFKRAVNAGVTRVVFGDKYRPHPAIKDSLDHVKVEFVSCPANT